MHTDIHLSNGNDVSPTYFQIGKINKIKDKKKEINIKFENPLLGNCANGASVNDKTGHLLDKLYGIKWPNHHGSDLPKHEVLKN